MRAIKIYLFLSLCILSHVLKAQKYTSDSVIFKSSVDTMMYGATITKPLAKGKFPALVIVSGTGAQDREGNMGGVKWFTLLADYLTKQGYIVLRMDDRGVGKTTGVYEDANTYDFALDAIQAVEFLKKDKKVDSKRIGLLGHSEGGAAISIAASLSTDIKFLISLSGLAMNGMDALITQNEALVNAAKLKERERIRFNEVNAFMFAKAYQYADSTNAEQAIREAYGHWRKRDSAYFELQDDKFDTFRFPIHRYAPQVATRWYRFFVRYNAELYLSKVMVPILAINGKEDNFVTPGNLSKWKAYAGAGHNKNVETHLLDGLNHLLQPEAINKEKMAANEEKIGIDPQVLSIIGEWLKKQSF